jgi:delta-aminolevulinic acid dehydratase/porphobilinogen synthase
MMDGQVGVVRAALDADRLTSTAILAYTAKYASAFFGPFREAVESTLEGDRRGYQQDPANADEALRELALDLAEGADIVMVKPALPYLDVLRRVADEAARHGVPVAAYQVSGEYAMAEAAFANGWLDRERTILETLTSIRRAGAGIVLTYWAVEAAGSAPSFGDRRGYQMDPGNVREALRECELDAAEGADVLMVKPALPYLDVLRAVRDRFDLPLAAYNVSGEYAMVKAAAAAGDLDERAAAVESLTSIRRAGADLIFTYWAKEFASWL